MSRKHKKKTTEKNILKKKKNNSSLIFHIGVKLGYIDHIYNLIFRNVGSICNRRQETWGFPSTSILTSPDMTSEFRKTSKTENNGC